MNSSMYWLVAAWTCYVLAFHPKMSREVKWDLRAIGSVLAVACIVTHLLNRL